MPETIPFVKLVEKGVMQFVILSKAKEQGGVTQDNLRQVFQQGNMRMQGNHLDECIRDLKQTNHLREEGNKLVITDDGREDVQKVQHLLLEAPQVTNLTSQRGTSARSNVPQQSSKTGANI